jgi:hypothetical protein
MAVGLFELASVAGNGEVSREAMAAVSDAFVCGVVADCRTCGRTAVIWLGGGFTSLADACGKCASMENAADCFALMLLMKVFAAVGRCNVLVFCMLMG